MHLPDGFISPQISLPAFTVAAPFWILAARRHFGHSVAQSLPIIGSITALAFVIQTIMIPVPGGTSTHLLGIMLLALLYSPLVAFMGESLVLLVQAIFFGAGGITVLGINSLALGLVGPFLGWLCWKILRGASQNVAAFTAGWVSMQASTLSIVFVLGLQNRLDSSYFPIPSTVAFFAMLTPSLFITGVAEGLYTVFALSLVHRAQLRGTNV